MDIYKALEQLKAEKKRLDAAIAALEQSAGTDREPGRGRVWNADARRRAAERMRKYWEKRRSGKAAGGGSAPAGEGPGLTGPPVES
jgi:septal ring factor EnvC (AmiA/AmiB activator)